MTKAIIRGFKRFLTWLGSLFPESWLHAFSMVLNYMRLGRWMRVHGFTVPVRFPLRDGVFGLAAEKIREARVLYLEFGVYQGASMRWWSAALNHPFSHLHGFDSFEGLPENFDDTGSKYARGWFSTDGQTPKIDDPRVRFYKGWFDQTLPGYILPDHEVLFVNIDADLYSSAIYVLHALKPYFKQGVYLYMDDMSRPDHEPRALEEFMQESGLRFRVIAADTTMNNVLFICEGK